jgi:hypothetical protein
MVRLEADRPAHETSDVDPGTVARSMLAILAAVAVVAVLVWGLYGMFGSTSPGEKVLPAEPDRTRLRGPVLKLAPPHEAEEIQRQQRELLEGYDWVSRETGVVRIPIERAMELYLQEQQAGEAR